MIIKVKPSWEISENLVTPEEFYLNRRQLFKAGAASLAVSMLPSMSFAKDGDLTFKKNELYKVEDKNRPLTKEDLVTHYNNFYEFSLDKNEVAKKVDNWKVPKPWTVEVKGLKGGNKTFDVDQLVKMAGGLEERIYRFRCVEAWSMVIPWVGFPLAELIKKLDPAKDAKFVKFTTYDFDKSGIKSPPGFSWPYVEGLTMEEAMHPLTMLATGMYGKEILKQNGAPIRLVVPWKYGFKNIKSIVKIEFVKDRPVGLWEKQASEEYGFYANVNPKKDHPRWSQATERVINGKFIPTRIETLMFNGYEKEVAGLYKGIDLQKNY
jgi:sulfoxide reductase catalytic subunit YedY